MTPNLKRSTLQMLFALATFGLWVTPSASADGPPVNIAPPQLSGSPIAGETLTASNGEWQGNPSSFSYQWLHCSKRGIRGTPLTCSPITAPNSPQYALTELDLSAQIAVEVTATNAFGSSTARSALTAEVLPYPRTHPHAKLKTHPPKRT